MRRVLIRVLGLIIVVALIVAASSWRVGVLADTGASLPVYSEPVVLASKGGVLEVTLTARQGKGRLDTVEAPVDGMLLFGYKLIKGTASDGKTAGANLYPAPTLNVRPGDTLIVHLENQLVGLDIADFFDPAYTPAGKEIPKTPAPLTNAPFNLHTHGLHVSPMGNSDNVLLTLSPGARNTYTFTLPADHPQGMYWYHGHLHTLTTAQTYCGLAGMLVVGRADGGIPAVSQGNLPVRSMALQYNAVYGRQAGLHQLNNPNWGQFVSTRIEPKPGQLESGAYKPSLAPVNFDQTPAGTKFLTNWYAGELSIDNHRGQFQMIPNNLMDFRANDGSVLAANPGLPDVERDIQFTVNGQFQPAIKSRPGQTEIWVLANISDMAYMRVRLTETATGKHPPIVILAQDGLPYTKAAFSNEGDGTTLSISPASRYAIAVTIPKTGELVLEMPPADDLFQDYTMPGVAYTSQGPGKPATGALGSLHIDPKFISYFDGFFIFPTQILLRAQGVGPLGNTVAFASGQQLKAHTSFVQTDGREPAVRRDLIINGGFLDDKASGQEPKAFIYAFDGRAFPNTVLLRPRLNTIEEWTFENYNNDEHPIHIHVNDFQVTELVDPVKKTRLTYQPFGQDNVNIPAPLMEEGEKVVAPGKLSVRTEFRDFLGSYVIHCHRLNHEDNGLMAMVNVIPAVSTYAVADKGRVQIRNNVGDKTVATVQPFAGYSGRLSLAMGDIDGDAVLDLIAGTGPGVPAGVVAYSGAGATPFQRELARFAPFGGSFSGGVNVASGSLDGSPGRDNLVVGSGAGMESRVLIFSSRLPAVGNIPKVVGDFKPYPGQKAGVKVAVGMVESASGLNSILTVPGLGQPSIVRVFRYELENSEFCSVQSGPKKIAEFSAFGPSYKGGVSLACDWTAGDEGGAQMILVGQQTTPGGVRAFSSGSWLDGAPGMYTKSPNHHLESVNFRSVADFAPFESGGVEVATTSTTAGADLLVGGVESGKGLLLKYRLARAEKKDRSLSPKLVGRIAGAAGALGGD